jgi:hypothetical protein
MTFARTGLEIEKALLEVLARGGGGEAVDAISLHGLVQSQCSSKPASLAIATNRRLASVGREQVSEFELWPQGVAAGNAEGGSWGLGWGVLIVQVCLLVVTFIGCILVVLCGMSFGYKHAEVCSYLSADAVSHETRDSDVLAEVERTTGEAVSGKGTELKSSVARAVMEQLRLMEFSEPGDIQKKEAGSQDQRRPETGGEKIDYMSQEKVRLISDYSLCHLEQLIVRKHRIK